jgi:hypothetical protein
LEHEITRALITDDHLAKINEDITSGELGDEYILCGTVSGSSGPMTGGSDNDCINAACDSAWGSFDAEDAKKKCQDLMKNKDLVDNILETLKRDANFSGSKIRQKQDLLSQFDTSGKEEELHHKFKKEKKNASSREVAKAVQDYIRNIIFKKTESESFDWKKAYAGITINWIKKK